MSASIYLTYIQELCQFITTSDLFPVPVTPALKSYLTAWCDQTLSNRALNVLTVSTAELGRLFQIFTIRVENNVRASHNEKND